MANVPGLNYGVKPVHDPTKRDSVLNFETNQKPRSSWFSRGGSGIIGSVISAGAGLLDSALNRRYAKRADKLNYERYLEERRYNSPAAAAARMRAAGLDPRAVTGQIASSAAASGTPQYNDPGTGGSIASGGLAAAQNLLAAGQMDIDSMRQAVEAEKAHSDMFLSSKSAERLVEETKNLTTQGLIIQSQQRIQAAIEEVQIGYGNVSWHNWKHEDGSESKFIGGGRIYVQAYVDNIRDSLSVVLSNIQNRQNSSSVDNQVATYVNNVAVDFNTAVIMRALSDEGIVLPAYELRNAVQEFYKRQKENDYFDVDKIAGYISLGLDSIDTILDFLPASKVKKLGKYLGRK